MYKTIYIAASDVFYILNGYSKGKSKMKIVNQLTKGRRNFIAEVSNNGGATIKKVIVISDNPDNTDTDGYSGKKIDISEADVQLFLQDHGYTVYGITVQIV